MSSETSTSSSQAFQAWHFYLLLGMAAATVAVWRAVDTQPAALILISSAVLAAALVAIAVHYSILAFMGATRIHAAPIDRGTRAALEQEKAIVLRSIKELEFDRSMGKVSQADFDEINARLRAKALSLMEQLEATPVVPPAGANAPETRAGTAVRACGSCGVENDADARFCKSCGTKVAR
jgi:membrane glycosyltransferase